MVFATLILCFGGMGVFSLKSGGSMLYSSNIKIFVLCRPRRAMTLPVCRDALFVAADRIPQISSLLQKRMCAGDGKRFLTQRKRQLSRKSNTRR